MQTRKITVDYARPRGYDVGYRAENNFTELSLPVPVELEGADSYRVYFESTVGEYLQTELLTPADGYVTVKITSDIVPEPGNMAAQLVAFRAGEIVGYAPMITGTAKVSIPDGTARLSHSLAAEIALNTAARHTHDNKPVLDKFAEGDDGEPTYNGIAIGSGGTGGDFIIKMTVEANGDNYTVTACDKTMEQIDAAVTSGQNIKAIAFDKYITPLIQMQYSESYTFGAFLGSFLVAANVAKNPESGTDDWQFYLEPITADIVGYYNAALPNISTVGGALDELVPKSHSHATGSNITLANNTEYRLADVTTLTLTYPTSDFECWMRLTFATSGTITVTLPAETKYIGTAPDFKNGETWELSFKDKVLAAQKVGEGT